MLRFNTVYYNQFKAFARDNLGTATTSIGISERRDPFRDWITKFDSWNEETPFTDIDNLRQIHNDRYSEIVKSLQKKEVSKGLRETKDVANFVLEVRISNARRPCVTVLEALIWSTTAVNLRRPMKGYSLTDNRNCMRALFKERSHKMYGSPNIYCICFPF